MADQPRSARFQTLFESALQAYEKKTGITLAQHPLALQLQSCHSADDVTAVLQGQAKAFSDFHSSNKIMKAIKTTVSILTPISDAAAFADAVGLVRQEVLMAYLTSLTFSFQTLFPPAKAVQAGLAVLLNVCAVCRFIYRYHCDIRVNQAAKGVISSGDVLVDLLESIEQFVLRLDIYTQNPLTPAIVEIVMKIMVELLSTLALVTKELKERRSSKCILADAMRYITQRDTVKLGKKFFGDKDIEAALQRLDRLTQDEVRNTAAQTLGVVYGLSQNMREFMDGKQLHLTCNPWSAD
jgi:hypothetical protein